MQRSSLRSFLQCTFLTVAALAAATACRSWRPAKAAEQQQAAPATAQAAAPTQLSTEQLLSLVHAPQFPEHDFSIIDQGAQADGKSDAKPAIDKAIAACNTAGGGRVVVPPGDYMVNGPIHLKSNVNLYLEKGATLKFSTNPADYPLTFTRFESTEVMNYSPLVYAFEQENIALTGEGVLDGQGSVQNWWGWAIHGGVAQPDIAKLRAMGQAGTPVAERRFGQGFHLRPNFFQPFRCKNVLLEGVTFKNSPMWFLNPALCENVIIRNVHTQGHGPNNDGCDPECSKNILIEGCTFDAGDDCIAIKSGRDTDGRRINVPTENVLIRNCKMLDGHGGVVLGSEITGGIRNVLAENCEMDSPHLQRALRIKSNSLRGGFVENVLFRNIHVGQVSEEVFLIEMFYAGEHGTNYPRIENITMQDVTVEQAPRAFNFTGVPELPIHNITVRHCDFESIEQPDILFNVEDFNCLDLRINGFPRSRQPVMSGQNSEAPAPSPKP